MLSSTPGGGAHEAPRAATDTDVAAAPTPIAAKFRQVQQVRTAPMAVAKKKGGKKKLCVVGRCPNQARYKGSLCWTHGGKPCSVDACSTKTFAHGLCWKHGDNNGASSAAGGAHKPTAEKSGGKKRKKMTDEEKKRKKMTDKAHTERVKVAKWASEKADVSNPGPNGW